jgi:membrane protein implicated in regulation of membrane protease activity
MDISAIEPWWLWLIAGVILIAAEIIAPGVFLMWLGFAALVTGVASWLLPIGWGIQTGLFAVLAVAAVYGARRWLVSNPITSSDPMLNDRAARMIGQVVTVVAGFSNGMGRVKVGDSEWNARGCEAAAGAQVRITRVEGSTLIVEPAG